MRSFFSTAGVIPQYKAKNSRSPLQQQHFICTGYRVASWKSLKSWMIFPSITDLLSFSVEYHGKPFGTPFESQTFYVFDPLVLLDFVRTRELSQEGTSLSEWDCLSLWHRCQKLLGSHPSWDKWSLGLGERGTDPSFDVSAVKSSTWRRLSKVVASSWTVECFCSHIFSMFSGLYCVVIVINLKKWLYYYWHTVTLITRATESANVSYDGGGHLIGWSMNQVY